MKAMMRAMSAAALAMLCISVAAPAKADYVAKMANQTNIPAKGVMQNVGIVWLKPGQVEDVRAKGNWTVKSCFANTCPPELRFPYTVNFENLENANIQYCVWVINRQISEGSGAGWGQVTLSANLTYQAPGFKCQFGGQLTAPYHSSAQGLGATMNFSVQRQ
ncbi:MAG TPA: hypothetical protein VGO34_13245 [Alphaproteobacteria bacterium]